MFTKRQQMNFDTFVTKVTRNENLLMSSEERGFGKSYVIDKLCDVLMSFGYTVYFLSKCNSNGRIKRINPSKFINTNKTSYIGISTDNAVVLVDEANYYNIEELMEYFNNRNIPVIGYADFRKMDTNKFSDEYTCKWCGK